jgi:hypothetical protein
MRNVRGVMVVLGVLLGTNFLRQFEASLNFKQATIGT